MVDSWDKQRKAKHAYEAAMGIGSWSKDIHKYLKNDAPTDKKCSSSHRPESSLENTFRTILMTGESDCFWLGWETNYFVWLHSRERYDKDTHSGRGNYEWPGYYREYILCTAKELGLPIIDIHKSVFAPLSRPTFSISI